MTEIIGLVSAGAGLTSLSIQPLETAVELRQVYKSYRDAPKTLELIGDEIEPFSLLLRQIEQDLQAHDVSDNDQAELLGRSIKLCQDSVASIGTTTGKLELAIGTSKRLGKLKNVVEEKEVRELCAELERAKSSLWLAHQFYTESRRRQNEEKRWYESQHFTKQQEAVMDRMAHQITLLPRKMATQASSLGVVCRTSQNGSNLREAGPSSPLFPGHIKNHFYVVLAPDGALGMLAMICETACMESVRFIIWIYGKTSNNV